MGVLRVDRAERQAIRGLQHRRQVSSIDTVGLADPQIGSMTPCMNGQFKPRAQLPDTHSSAVSMRLLASWATSGDCYREYWKKAKAGSSSRLLVGFWRIG